jgi:transcriptional regulator with XRE-family HTH domain
MFKNALHELLTEYNLPLLTVAQGTGIDYGSLHSWATNKRSMIPYRPLILLAIYFEVSPTRIQPWLAKHITGEEKEIYLTRIVEELPKRGRRIKKSTGVMPAA